MIYAVISIGALALFTLGFVFAYKCGKDVGFIEGSNAEYANQVKEARALERERQLAHAFSNVDPRPELNVDDAFSPGNERGEGAGEFSHLADAIATNSLAPAEQVS